MICCLKRHVARGIFACPRPCEVSSHCRLTAKGASATPNGSSAPRAGEGPQPHVRLRISPPRILPGWLYEHNHHLLHSAIGNESPITRLANLPGQCICFSQAFTSVAGQWRRLSPQQARCVLPTASWAGRSPSAATR